MKSPFQIGFQTIKAVAKIICGDPIRGGSGGERLSPYRTHTLLEEFFLDDLKLPRDESVVGGSRAKWTEAWLKVTNGTDNARKIIEGAVRPADYKPHPEFLVANAVEYLNRFLVEDRLRLVPSGSRYVLATAAGVSLAPSNAADILSDAYVTELSHKIDAKLAEGDLEGAITNARTLLEAILVELERRLAGTRSDFKGDLPKQFKTVAKLLRLDDQRTDLDERFKDVVRGLVQIVNGLAPLRNKMSDSHARERKPVAHHAALVANATKTAALFLVQSYDAQMAHGKLPGAV